MKMLSFLGLALISLSAQAQTITMTGLLNMGVLAIGGETTGAILSDGETTRELILSGELKGILESREGRIVRVSGESVTLHGVERQERPAIDVQSVEVLEDEVLVGKLNTGVLAIGGETTGIVLETKSGPVELVLTPYQRRSLNQLSGQQVMVLGARSAVQGVETGTRVLLYVERIQPVKLKN